MMITRAPLPVLPDLRPGLRLADPAWPVAGLQGRRAATSPPRTTAGETSGSRAKSPGERLRRKVRAHPDRGDRPDADLWRTTPAGDPDRVRGPLQPTTTPPRPPAPPAPATPSPTSLRSRSSAGPSSAASSTDASELRRNPGQGRVLEPHKQGDHLGRTARRES